MMPQSRPPGVPDKKRLRRIERPASARRPARREETGDQHEDREQVEPIAQHVRIGKHHVARAEHQRDQIIAETAEKQRGKQVNHHDHAVHGDELIIMFRVDEREITGKAELQAHQPG